MQQYDDMIKNGFVNPSKFLNKEELMLIEEERLRQNLLQKNQLIALEKSKKNRFAELDNCRSLTDAEKNEMRMIEHDLILIDERKREMGIRD